MRATRPIIRSLTVVAASTLSLAVPAAHADMTVRSSTATVDGGAPLAKPKAAPKKPARPVKGTKRKAKKCVTAGLIATWTGVPQSGRHAGQGVTERWAFGGDRFTVVRTTTAGDDESIWGPMIDDGTAVPFDTAGQPAPAVSSELRPVPGGFCFADASYRPAWQAQRAYARAFGAWVARIEQLRTNRAARAALPAGPIVDGHATVVVRTDRWATLDRTGVDALLDSTTGAVVQLTPIGWPDWSVRVSAWSIRSRSTSIGTPASA